MPRVSSRRQSTLKSSKTRTPPTRSIIKWRTIPISVSLQRRYCTLQLCGFILIVNSTVGPVTRTKIVELKQQMKTVVLHLPDVF